MSSPEWRRTSRVLRRAAFGASGAEIDAAVASGVQAWVDRALAPTTADAGVAATPAPTFTALAPLPKNASQEDRTKRREEVRRRGEALTRWWLTRMVAATNPVPERVTFGWHDHWATSIAKVRDADAMLRQNETLRSRGLGTFTELAHAMVVDAALLDWLDAQKNTKTAPNENLARELMELFCLGVGSGYTETDVREAARALTGWRINDTGAAVLDAKRHDPGAKTVLGVSGALDAHGVVDAVLGWRSHPAHVASRWWRHLASYDNPPDDVLGRLTAAYGPQRDSRALVRTLLLDPGFAAAAGTVTQAPLEWTVGALRTLKVSPTDEVVTAALQTLRQLGQVPFSPPNVAGWPRGQAWLSTASAQTRAGAAQRLVAKADLSSLATAAGQSRIEAAVHLVGLDTVTNRTLDALKAATTPQQLVATLLISPDYLVV